MSETPSNHNQDPNKKLIDALAANTESNNKLADAISNQNQDGGRGRQSKDRATLAAQIASQTEEVDGDSDDFRTTSAELSRLERNAELNKLAKASPHTYFIEKMIRISNSAGSARPELMALGQVLDLPGLFEDEQTYSFKAARNLQTIAANKKSFDTKGWAASAAELDNKQMQMLINRMNFPIVVRTSRTDSEGNVEFENNLRKISFGSAHDILEKKPDLRAKFLSHNPDVRKIGETEWTDAILRECLGIDPTTFDSENTKFYLPKFAKDVKIDQVLSLSQKDLSNKSIVSEFREFQPFLDVNLDRADDEYLDVSENQRKISSLDDLRNSTIFIRKMVEDYMYSFGSMGRYDPLFWGKQVYPERKTLRLEHYVTVYGILDGNEMPFSRTEYTDLDSENSSKLIPQLEFLDSAKKDGATERKTFEAGLEDKSVNDLINMIGLSEFERKALNKQFSGLFGRQTQKHKTKKLQYLKEKVVDLRIRYAEDVYRSYYMQPRLEQYVHSIAEGNIVGIPSHILLRGFEGRRKKRKNVELWGQVVNITEFEDNTKIDFSREKGSDSKVDYLGYKQAKRFTLYNGTSISWLRNHDQMEKVAKGIVKYNPELFEGVDFTPMYLHGSQNKNELLSRLVGNSLSTGADGLVDMVNNLRRSDYRYGKLSATDYTKYQYYAEAGYGAAAARGGTTGALNVASENPAELSEYVRGDAARSEMGKAVETAIGDIFAPGHTDQQAQMDRARDIIDIAFSLNLYHNDQMPTKVYKTKKRLSAVQMEISPNEPDTGDLWAVSPVKDISKQRPELGIFPHLMYTGVDGDGNLKARNDALLGPAMVWVLESENRRGFQLAEENRGGRSWGFADIASLITHACDNTTLKKDPLLLYAYNIAYQYSRFGSISQGTQKTKQEKSNSTRIPEL